ncbi:alpha/beta fold hydrolase [Corynebacterium sp. HMSC30G07]|uniref:alpha/beta fold hydrolase n=1 Tax=Corynebacterium sp. HMSC30G07 TaxID=1581072 RepID=UPI0008A51BB6|nr:alpha/beta hydrolase [Corynebacterium sp. HMSC30G07]
MCSNVLLLHGVGLDSSVWDRLRKRLDYETTALDLLGHGQRAPIKEEVNLKAFADDVVSQMPQEPVHLVGFSLGGLVASRIAIDHPDRLLSLTIVNSVCERTEAERDAVRARYALAAEDLDASMNAALDRWFPPETPSFEELRSETGEVLAANDRESYLHAYKVFTFGDLDVAQDLRKVLVPTLIVTGEDDPGSTVDMAYRMQEKIPDSTVAVLPGARHMTPVTHVAELETLLTNHFDTAERRV